MEFLTNSLEEFGHFEPNEVRRFVAERQQELDGFPFFEIIILFKFISIDLCLNVGAATLDRLQLMEIDGIDWKMLLSVFLLIVFLEV